MSNIVTTDKFTYKASLKHKGVYDYSKVVYINNRTKVTIVCPTHGDFEQAPRNHLVGSGCQKCGLITSANKHLKTTEEWVLKAKAVHGNRYSYNKVDYKNNVVKVIITCPAHGDFEQKPASHINGRGCKKCAIASSHQMNPKSTEAFIQEGSKTHNGFYTYDKVVYERSDKKVIITCPVHGDFEQMPSNHIRGNGCPNCAGYGFNPDKPAILYYLRITTNDGQVLYKVGVTNRTVNERFSLVDLSKIEIIKQKSYECGREAYVIEQEILKTFKNVKYEGPNILESGNTELFTEDIVNGQN